MPILPRNADFHFERALFVIGIPGAGKSTQLRHIFQDVRFHTEGNVPPGAEVHRLREMYRISNERALYLRLTSPHEAEETLEEFITKTFDKISRNLALGFRWNFAAPLQPTQANNMPSAADTIAAFIQRFHPERVRALFLNPDRNGAVIRQALLSDETDKLWNAGAEVVLVDARSRDKNGLVLADFFDFT